MMDITIIQILEKTVSADKYELEESLRYLEQAAQTNLPEFLKSLSEVLKVGTNSKVARMQAGLQLKNQLTSKDPTVKLNFQQRWTLLPEDVRRVVKINSLESLGTESSRPSIAAQVVAAIGAIELPHGGWTDLIDILVTSITNSSSTEMLKGATLEAIGYLCQDIDPDVLQDKANQILTAIIHGMKKEELSENVRLAATNALNNSLEFTRANFEKETERHFIMQVVCEASQSTNTQIRVSAMQNLVKIMSLYYSYMESYMGPALFAISLDAMKSDVDEIQLQGIEFWSNVCDEEVELAIEAADAQEQGRPPERISRFYAKGALPHLMPVILEVLCKQEEFDDDDDWNPCKAAGVCLMLMATCCENDVISHVLPFVQTNIVNTDWKLRDAAAMAFGSILEGPDPETLSPYCAQAMPVFVNLLKDESVVVKDTAAWTIGRLCEIMPEVVLDDRWMVPLLENLVEGLNSEPRVAANVCWAFSSLAEAAYDKADPGDGSDPPTTALSRFFDVIIERLLATTDRTDGTSANLRSAAYEAVMEMIKNSAQDNYVAVQKTTKVILERLQILLGMDNNAADKAQLNDLQSLLCATLQSVLRKLTKEDVPHLSDTIMTALLQMFQSSNKTGSVQEDALMTVSTLAEVMGDGFIKYVEAFKPFLFLGLRNISEHQVCLAAVGVIGDICRGIGKQILPHCNELMQVLLEDLANEAVHRSVKPHILSVFGDIALAIGTEFTVYVEVILKTLQQASQANVDKTDYDLIDYLNELREGILESYQGIIQGLKGDDNEKPNEQVMLVKPYIESIIVFIEQVAQDEDHTDSNVAACAGLLGDLCTTFKALIIPVVEAHGVALGELLTEGRRSKTQKTKTLATWATKEIKKLKANNQ